MSKKNGIEKIIVMHILFILFLLFLFRIYYFSIMHQIGKAMCNGKNAVDGYLYIKNVAGFNQLILRCYYLKPDHLVQKEVILGWLKNRD